jgi:hypothetical protein
MKIMILHLVVATMILFTQFDPPEMEKLSHRLSRFRHRK